MHVHARVGLLAGWLVVYCHSVVTNEPTPGEEINRLQSEHRFSREMIHSLQDENAQLKQTLGSLQESLGVLEQDIRDLKQGRALATGSAFTAFDDSGKVGYSPGDVLPFQHVQVNIGNDYNAENSRYTCPAKGVYLFSTQSLTDGGSTSDMYIQVGSQADRAGYHADLGGTGGDVVSTLVIEECNAGDFVQVKVGERGAEVWGIYNDMQTSAFSGVLLFLL